MSERDWFQDLPQIPKPVEARIPKPVEAQVAQLGLCTYGSESEDSTSGRSCGTACTYWEKYEHKWTNTVQTWVVQGSTTGIYMYLYLCSIFGIALCKHWYELESSIFKSIVNCSNTIEGLLNSVAFPPLIWNVLLVINKSLYEELLKHMMLTDTSLPLLVLSQIHPMPIFLFLKYLIYLFDCVGS